MKSTEKKNPFAADLTMVWLSTQEPAPLAVFKSVQPHFSLKEEGNFGHSKV